MTFNLKIARLAAIIFYKIFLAIVLLLESFLPVKSSQKQNKPPENIE
jgi:hypothetical protein